MINLVAAPAWQAWLMSIWKQLQTKLPTLGVALGILLGGWLAAWIVHRMVYGGLKRTTWDDKIAEAVGFETGGDGDDRLERAVSKVVYYGLLAFVAVAFFDYLGIDAVTTPLVGMLGEFGSAVPNVLKALLIALVGYVVASGARRLITALVDRLGVEQKLRALTGDEEEEKPKKKKRKKSDEPSSVAQTAGAIAYWFILIIVAVPVLDALRVGALSGPLSSALETVTTYFPKVLAAAVLLAVGYFVARLVRTVLSSVLARVGLDRVVAKIGLGAVMKDRPLSSILGTIAMAFVLLQFAISAVGRLGIQEISVPLGSMLTQIYAYLPKLLVGLVLMSIGVVLARVVGNVSARLLAAMGFNTLMVQIGVFKDAEMARAQQESAKAAVDARREASAAEADDEADDADMTPDEMLAGSEGASVQTPADVAGVAVGAIIVLLFLRQVLGTMGLAGLAGLLDGFLAFLPNVLVAIALLGAGLWAGTWAHRRVDELTKASTDRIAKALGTVAHVSIVTISAMMALQQLGVGRQLIAIGFGLILGAICLAVALAFGLGGRDVASKILQKEYDRRRTGR